MQFDPIITTRNPEQMAANAPIKIGARGTVGSLVMKEIEYFKKVELERRVKSQEHQANVANVASSSTHARPGFWFFMMTWRRKKRGSSRFLPSICSAVEVSEANRLNGISGFNYRILKDDAKNFNI